MAFQSGTIQLSHMAYNLGKTLNNFN